MTQRACRRLDSSIVACRARIAPARFLSPTGRGHRSSPVHPGLAESAVASPLQNHVRHDMEMWYSRPSALDEAVVLKSGDKSPASGFERLPGTNTPARSLAGLQFASAPRKTSLRGMLAVASSYSVPQPRHSQSVKCYPGLEDVVRDPKHEARAGKIRLGSVRWLLQHGKL
ncbi:hypothetical protein BV20DRAFT_862612 [Pilatotrama ljubarskyi]|nr:hypothetical protein BV20DRAFT_862612 [Pilatotrama ljubarskyi]